MNCVCEWKHMKRLYGFWSIAVSLYLMFMLGVTYLDNPVCPKVDKWKWAVFWVLSSAFIGIVMGLFCLTIKKTQHWSKLFNLTCSIELLFCLASSGLIVYMIVDVMSQKNPSLACKGDEWKTFIPERALLLAGFIPQTVISFIFMYGLMCAKFTEGCDDHRHLTASD